MSSQGVMSSKKTSINPGLKDSNINMNYEQNSRGM